ncbi:trichohyalin isoform X1 [Micropterus salmoides]|uniref:trichohyalin isoform X1 n=1 Tax=Micropterus salmoides TaxID=27706 RepID=UPI0018ECBFB0|nr:trichohyalin isoform X1 [Micropterus salmoides]XP_038554561.1 trichohyalin isoform X1 [Micropterus salmoides]XP_038554562.1 trichohyalin isoform X1 [Micropterus salmoides]
MLSPSSSAQKNLGEEDSSGSDAGSEVGLEPETDRFGFIVTNGSTAGSVGPPPELVRQREAKWINIIGQWDRILLKKTSKVKVQCQKGIPASLRAKCWPLLCGATDRMKQNENLYQSLDSQPTLQSWVDVIERDLDRQFPFHEMFLSKDGHGQRGLFRVLKAYTQYQPEEGYCQAQGPVTAVLLMNMPAEEAFWCLVQISEQYLPGYYSPLLEGVLFDAAMLSWVLKRTCPAAHKHLQHHEVEPLMFATDWLMCLFTRHLPFNTLLRVWDLFFCYGVRVLLQVAVVLVRRVLGRAEQRKQCQGQMETLERLRGVREQVQEEDDTFIAEVCSVQLSARDLEKQTEKELVKWRKDRPSSTFDPRRRCQGYRMAWARARQREEERDRKEREKGNLSVPLARSASTLSLSPSLLHKRWRKGGKVNTNEWEGGGKVVRHLSMGAKEDWRSWAELDFKKVQGVQEEEDVVSEEHKKQPKLTGQTEKKEFLEGPKEIEKIQTIPTEQVEETVIVKEQIEQVQKRVTEKEKSHLKETDEGKMLSEQTEETNMDAEPTQYPDKDQTVENIPQPIEETADHKQREELNSCSQSQVLEQQSHQSEDQEIKDKETNTETEKQVSESEHSAAVEENQTETQSQVLEQQSHQSEDQEIKDKETNTETEKQVSESEHSAAVEENQTETQSQVLEQQSHQSEDQEIKDKETNTETEKQVSESEHSAAVEENQTETQSQVLEQQSHQSEDQVIEEKETNTETAKQEAESEHSAAVEENQTETQKDAVAGTNTALKMEVGVHTNKELTILADVKPEESTETESVQRMQVDTVTEVSETTTEASPGSETDSVVIAPPVTDPTAETEAQEQQQQVIPEREESSQGEEFEGKCHSTESLAETDMKEESHTHTETETDVLAQAQAQAEENAATQDKLEAEIVQIDSKQHIDLKTEAETLCSPQSIQPQEGTDLAADTETEAEVSVANDVAKESSEAFAQCPEEQRDAAAPQPTQEVGEIILTTRSVAQVDNDQTATETQLNEETHSDSIAPPQKEGTSSQAEAMNLTTEPDGKASSVETTTSGEPEETKVTVGAAEVEESTENVEENKVGEDDVFISTEPTDSANTDNNPQVQERDSHQTEPSNSGQTQPSGRRSSRSSGDFCVRKSSSSRGSRLGRRLSEDLFTMPQKTSQSQAIPNQPEVEAQSSPGAVNPNLTPPEVTSLLSAEVTERTAVQQQQQPPPDPPKRFGLFRRLRGEQPKKAKGTPKMQVPKILIQDFSDGTETGKPVEEEGGEKVSSRERRRRRREQERRQKEEERLRKKREKEEEKEKERERRKPQTRGKSFQVQRDTGSSDAPEPAKTGSQTLRYSASCAESYF